MNEFNYKNGKDFFNMLSDVEKQRLRFRGMVSAVIFNARTALKMNQTEFAKFMGVTRNTVRKWESCEYNFTVDLLIVICNKLDIGFNVIFGDLNLKEYIGL